MGKTFKTGQSVSWHYGSGTAHGKIAERFERRVSRTIKGKRIVRVGTSDNPAYLVEQKDGDRALKRGSELATQ